MNTLYELTGRRRGIVLHRGHEPISCDWSSMLGIPRWFGNEYRALGESIPKVQGHWDDYLMDWFGKAEFPGRRKPERGWVYEIGDIVIIAPDEWV